MGRTVHSLDQTRLAYLDAIPCHGRLSAPADHPYLALAHRSGQACDVWAEHATDFVYDPPADATLIAIAVQIAELARCLNQLPADQPSTGNAHQAPSGQQGGRYVTVPIVPAWRMMYGDQIRPATRAEILGAPDSAPGRC
jgi:hypothetical protein